MDMFKFWVLVARLRLWNRDSFFMGSAAAAGAAFGATGCRSELSSLDCRLVVNSGTELSFPSVEVVFYICWELF